MSSSGALVVLAKVPRPGRVKTRMCPPLSDDEAAQLYGRMLDDVLVASARFARELDLDAVLAIHPQGLAGEVLSRVPRSFRVIAQRGSDLSQRMRWAISEVAAGGAEKVLLRGSDSPALDAGRVGQALDALSDNDLVLCPDLDGGYNLVGLGCPVGELFDHPMSTGSVLEQTLARAGQRGLRSRVLEPAFDLDTAADLALLQRARAEGRAATCSRTLAFLDERNLWRHVRSRVENPAG